MCFVAYSHTSTRIPELTNTSRVTYTLATEAATTRPEPAWRGLRWSLFCCLRIYNATEGGTNGRRNANRVYALSDLLRTERNPKKHDLPSLRASMLRWGFTQPLAIDERTGKLVEGRGRIEVLQEIQKVSLKPPLRVTAMGKEGFAPVVREREPAYDQEAEAYLIAANQLTTAGGWEDALLGSMLAQLKGATPRRAAMCHWATPATSTVSLSILCLPRWCGAYS